MTLDIDIGARIREDIVGGVLPFGARVTIAELAQRYGVSQMPIRTALSQLQGEGLVQMSETGRAAIRTIDRTLVGNIFDIRGAMEVLLIKSAARAITDEELDALDAAEREFERCVHDEDYPAVQAANRRFHKIIASSAQNADAVELLDRHFLLVAALWRRVSYGPERYSGVVSDHQYMLRALRARDADAAAALAQAHVVKAKLFMLDCFDRTFPPPGRPARARRIKKG